MNRRHPWRASFVALAACVGVAACGRGGNSDSPMLRLPDASTTTVIAAPSSAPTTAAAAAGGSIPPAALAAATAATPPPTTTAPTTTLPRPLPPPPENEVEPELVVGQIAIPRLGLDLVLYQGITLPTLDKGPGHWPGTALPGQQGNVVVAGHRVSRTRPFRYIERLVEGDEVTFTVGDATHRYVVVGHETVTPDAIRIIEQTPEYTATLFACHPPGSTEYRWVVHLRYEP